QAPWLLSAEDGRAVTYGELHRLTRQVATFLRERGIGRNDRVALLANNGIEHLACYVGVVAYGATICTVHVEMNRHHLDNILPAVNPRLVVFDPALGLDALLSAVAAPQLPLGTWTDRHAGFYAAVTSCEPSEAHVDAAGEHDAVIVFTSG